MSALSEHTIIGPILEHIAIADGHQLRRILNVTIPHTKGISDEEREQFKQAVNARYAELNAEAVGQQKGRW